MKTFIEIGGINFNAEFEYEPAQRADEYTEPFDSILTITSLHLNGVDWTDLINPEVIQANEAALREMHDEEVTA